MNEISNGSLSEAYRARDERDIDSRGALDSVRQFKSPPVNASSVMKYDNLDSRETG
jgi:hypothetical protein